MKISLKHLKSLVKHFEVLEIYVSYCVTLDPSEESFTYLHSIVYFICQASSAYICETTNTCSSQTNSTAFRAHSNGCRATNHPNS